MDITPRAPMTLSCPTGKNVRASVRGSGALEFGTCLRCIILCTRPRPILNWSELLTTKACYLIDNNKLITIEAGCGAHPLLEAEDEVDPVMQAHGHVVALEGLPHE
eukprot:3617452-Pyramimonas_sp.AAC.1